MSQDETQKQQTEGGAETAAAADKTQTISEDQATTQFVTFKLGQEEFAFHMDRVREIQRVERPSEVPNTPATQKTKLNALTTASDHSEMRPCPDV